MPITRDILPELRVLLKEYPIVTILGPRQAGKTTLAKEFLDGFAYANLEDPEQRELATADPKGFLSTLGSPAIIDEIQRVPELLSYLQVAVDEHSANGCYVLTGSHQLSLRQAITQSLAGRTAILNLMPLSIAELRAADIVYGSFEEYAFRGFLPRVYSQKQRPSVAYANYYQTYVERDVRQLIQLKDASLFEKCLKLMAGRTGQILDYSSLANDVGVDAKTIRHWISILEASFILFKLPPYFENFGKRAIKSPKYYFTDTGLLCHLLNIRESGQVTRDPLVGAIFENLAIMEYVKETLNRGRPAELYFFRDSNGNEVDLLVPDRPQLKAIEIKSATTFKMSRFNGLQRFSKIAQTPTQHHLIYNGEPKTLSDGTTALPFHAISGLFPSLPERNSPI